MAAEIKKIGKLYYVDFPEEEVMRGFSTKAKALAFAKKEEESNARSIAFAAEKQADRIKFVIEYLALRALRPPYPKQLTFGF